MTRGVIRVDLKQGFKFKDDGTDVYLKSFMKMFDDDKGGD